MINYVIIKPDAFTTKISSEIARQLFFDFAYFLIYDEVNKDNKICCKFSEEAVQQIKERAISEESFRRKNKNLIKITDSLISYAKENYNGGLFVVSEVLEMGLNCLKMKDITVKKISLTFDDVEAIYSDSDEAIMEMLHEYLDGQDVHIVDMGNTDRYILQWWKTFVRHYFLDYSQRKYYLRNLIHVVEEKVIYISKRIGGQNNGTDYMGKG